MSYNAQIAGTEAGFRDPILQQKWKLLTEQTDKIKAEVNDIIPARLNVYNAQIQNIKENTLNRFMENKLFELGVTKSDNVGMRILLQGLQKQFPNLFKHYGL